MGRYDLLNPDTSGPSFLVAIDSFKTYYRGDGLPDFKGASPPPAPVVNTFSAMGSVMLRWNGQDAETGRDQFTGQQDFEGYRVYFAKGTARRIILFWRHTMSMISRRIDMTILTARIVRPERP